MKNYLVLFLIFFSFYFNAQETYQIAVFDSISNKNISIDCIEDLGNGNQVFTGKLRVIINSIPIIGHLDNEGKITKSIQLNVPFEKDISNSIKEIYAHPGNDMSFVFGNLLNEYLIRINDQNDIKYVLKLPKYGISIQKLLIDDFENSYVNFYESDTSILIKLDENGKKIWAKSVSNHAIYSMSILSTGNLLVTYSASDPDYVGVVILDPDNGDVLHHKTIDQISVFCTIDKKDNIILFRSSNVFPQQDGPGILIKLDSELNEIWSKQISLSHNVYNNYHRLLVVDNNNDMLITSYNASYDVNNGISFIKIDEDGNEIFRRLYLSNKIKNGGHSLISDNHFMTICNLFTTQNFTASILKTGLNLESEGCSFYNYCSGIEDVEIVITEGGSIENATVDEFELIDGASLSPIKLFSSEICNQITPPNANFSVENQAFCFGEELVLNENSISELGISTWNVKNLDTSYVVKDKILSDIIIDAVGSWEIIHSLEINNCVLMDTFNFNVVIQDFLDSSYVFCEDDPLELTIPLEMSDFLWDDQSTNNTNTYFESGEHFISYKDEIGCEFKEFFNLEVNLLPSVLLPTDSITCLNTEYGITFDAYEIDTFYWDDNYIGESRIINKEGSYTVIVENECGTMEDTHTAIFENCNKESYFPTVFSPNGDGLNDIYTVYVLNQTLGKCNIYDRWGSLVYSSESEISWNGTHLGKQVKQGVYSYFVELIDYDNSIELVYGTLMVIR